MRKARISAIGAGPARRGAGSEQTVAVPAREAGLASAAWAFAVLDEGRTDPVHACDGWSLVAPDARAVVEEGWQGRAFAQGIAGVAGWLVGIVGGLPGDVQPQEGDLTAAVAGM